MSNKNSPTKYNEEFKKTIVTLYQSGLPISAKKLIRST